MVSGQQPAAGGKVLCPHSSCYCFHHSWQNAVDVSSPLTYLACLIQWLIFKKLPAFKNHRISKKRTPELSVLLGHWEHTYILKPVLLVLYGSCHFMGDMLFSSSRSLSSLNGPSAQVVTGIIYQFKLGPCDRGSYFVSIYWARNILKNLCSVNRALKWPIFIAPLPVSPGPPQAPAGIFSDGSAVVPNGW